jgi:pimeloyl-ACP methyl ester carboxylesterase
MRSLIAVAIGLVLAAPAARSAAAPSPSITDAPIRTVQAGQGTIGYCAIGPGRPLVLIMGLSGTMDAWAPSFVDSLAARRRVIVFDNEGIRQTPLGPGTLTIGHMADDAAALIRALRLRRPDVLALVDGRDDRPVAGAPTPEASPTDGAVRHGAGRRPGHAARR